MLRLAAVCGLLTVALSFDFGGTDEAEYESILREKGYPEDDIQQFLQVRSFQIGITVRFYWAINLSSVQEQLQTSHVNCLLWLSHVRTGSSVYLKLESTSITDFIINLSGMSTRDPAASHPVPLSDKPL